MSQRKGQNLCSKFSTIKNGKINFAFDPAEKPDTLKPINQLTKRRTVDMCKKCMCRILTQYYSFVKSLLKFNKNLTKIYFFLDIRGICYKKVHCQSLRATIVDPSLK